MASGLPALLRRAARGSGDLHAGQRGTRRRVGDLRAQALAPSRTDGPGGGRTLGRLSPLPLRLPTSAGGATRDTRELWERYLVYGIAFGIAERVLQGAQLHMPEAVRQASSIWISSSGDLGSGATSLSIGDLAPGSATLAPELGCRWRRRRLLGRGRRRRRGRGRRVRLSLVRPGPKEPSGAARVLVAPYVT